MSNTEIRLRRVFADVFGVPEADIFPESSPDTMEAWDSLQHVLLSSAISEEFGIVIEPEYAMEMLNFGLALKVVDQLVGNE